MTPEIQVMVQATQYIMQAIMAVYSVLSVAFLAAASYALLLDAPMIFYEHSWGTPIGERIMTALKVGVLLACVVMGVIFVF